jgi:nucleoid DNA-binding protein
MLQAFTEIVTDALVRSESLFFPGLGTFDVKTRAARKGGNPKCWFINSTMG